MRRSALPAGSSGHQMQNTTDSTLHRHTGGIDESWSRPSWPKRGGGRGREKQTQGPNPFGVRWVRPSEVPAATSALLGRGLHVVALAVAEQVLVLRPALRQRVHAEDIAEVLVEPHPTVNAVVALALASSAALQPTVDDVGDPAEPKLAISGDVAAAHRFLAKEHF